MANIMGSFRLWCIPCIHSCAFYFIILTPEKNKQLIQRQDIVVEAAASPRVMAFKAGFVPQQLVKAWVMFIHVPHPCIVVVFFHCATEKLDTHTHADIHMLPE
jgi:hypothetical protein